MSKRPNILTSLAALGTGGFVTRILLIATELIVARSYGADGFGAFSTALVFATVFGYAISFGMDTYLLREISQQNDDARSILGDVYLTKFALGIVVYGTMILIAVWLDYPGEIVRLILIFGIYVSLLSFQETIAAIFQSQERMMPIAVFRTIQSLCIFALAFVVIQLDYTTTIVAFVYLAVSLIVTVFWYRRASQLIAADIRQFRPLLTLRNCYIFGLSGALFILNYNFDTIMLSVMRTHAEVGYYSAAYKFVDILFKIPVIVSFAILPRLFAQFATDKDGMFRTYQTVFRYLLIVGALITIVLFTHASSIITFVYGKEYLDAAPVLQILSWSILFTFMMAPTSDQLVSANKQKYNLLGWFFAVLINIVTNWLVIPRYGIIGAAVATLASQLVLYVLHSYFLWKHVHQAHVLRQIPKPFLCLSMAYVATVLASDLVGPFVALIVTISVFLIGLIVTRTISPDELRSLIPGRH